MNDDYENQLNNSIEEENILNNNYIIEFNEIFPKIISKKNKKTSYIEHFGYPNELNLFWGHLSFNKNIKK